MRKVVVGEDVVVEGEGRGMVEEVVEVVIGGIVSVVEGGMEGGDFSMLYVLPYCFYCLFSYCLILCIAQAFYVCI